jgi:hypothetical protein
MSEFGSTLRWIRRLIRAMRLLERPILVTEQYPRGLGRTLPSVAKLLPEEPIEKVAFSCYGCDAFAEAVGGFEDLLLCGIEAHVCVLQTALSGVAAGQRVFVAADAVTSRAPANKAVALEQMGAAGVVVASVETLLFQLLVEAGTDTFRAVSKLVR